MADTFEVVRKTTIKATREAVFAKIGSLEAWEDWSPWAQIDPGMEKTYSGESGKVGSSYHWTGNRKVGEGKMTMTEVDAPGKVAINLEFLKPFKAQNVTEMHVADAGNASEVTWRMTGQHTFMSKIMGIFKSMDKMVGPDFEKGLASLRQQLEA